MGRDQKTRWENRLMTFEDAEWIPRRGDREGEVACVTSLIRHNENTEGLGVRGGDVDEQGRETEEQKHKRRTWRSGGEDGKRHG